MQQATHDTQRRKRSTRGLAILATLLLAGFIAAPAQAGGNEFDDGFQDQLGRLVATEVFSIGKYVLTSGAHGWGHYPAAEHRYERRERRYGHRDRRDHDHDHEHYRPRPRRRHYDHDDDYAHRRHYWRKHYRHDHDYDAPCNVETRERVRRNHRGEVVEYERRERRYRDYARW